MNRTVILIALVAIATGCTSAVTVSPGSPSSARESSLMQADRDFAAATHARGIDGWMSFYAPDAIRIRYRGNMVKGFDEIRKFDFPYISDTTSVLNWEPTDAHIYRDVAPRPGAVARHHGHRLSGAGDSGPIESGRVHAHTQQKTPHPFGYGAHYWRPTRPIKLIQ